MKELSSRIHNHPRRQADRRQRQTHKHTQGKQLWHIGTDPKQTLPLKNLSVFITYEKLFQSFKTQKNLFILEPLMVQAGIFFSNLTPV